MKLRVFTNEYEVSEELYSYIESKTRLMLGRYESRIDKIELHLMPPQLNQDATNQYVCKIHTLLAGMASVEVQEMESNLLTAIDNGIHRTKRGVERLFRLSS
ncbi:hypothetical protein [Algicola sagamiensis]|uniref:hypothetical protein n=1 Tax=Algicola sagamiensis TaxID=163869 RepID=UPI0003639DD7|nr:hypothetical protein [Algicola sagamiensis]